MNKHMTASSSFGATIIERGMIPVLAWMVAVQGALLGGCAQSDEPCTLPSECQLGYTCEDGRCVPVGDTDADAVDVVTDDGPVGDTPVDDVPVEDAPVDVPVEDSTVDDDEICAEASFPYSNTQELFTVPANARYMHVKAWGAGGNEEHLPGDCPGIVDDGGLGGFSEAVFEVSPGAELIIIVGKLGRAGDPTEDRIRFGFGQWGGGGLTGIFLGPEFINENSQDKALIIAGGGGGSGGDCSNPAGTGNHPDSGGETTMLGGEGADGVNGGGGGYEGGTGGPRGGPGMGGMGFVRTEGAYGAIDYRMLAAEPGDGVPPKTDDTDYADDAGLYEHNGRIVLHFVCEPPPLL